MKQLSLFILCFMMLSSFAKDWINSSQHPAYPRGLYVLGMGMSEHSLEQAKRAAQADVKKQISVHIQSSFIDEQTSESKNGVELYYLNTVKSYDRSYSSGDIQGVQIVETLEKNGIHYALAALDKMNFASKLRAEIKSLNDEMSKIFGQASASIDKGDFTTGLADLSKIGALVIGVEEKLVLLSAVTTIEESDRAILSPADLGNLYAKCVSEIKIKLESGNRQTINSGELLAEDVVFIVVSGKKELANIMVDIINEEDKVIASSITDENGKVTFTPEMLGYLPGGDHNFASTIRLKVKAEYQKILRRKARDFSVKVTAHPIYVKLKINSLPGFLDAGSVHTRVAALLKESDYLIDNTSTNTVEVSVEGTVQDHLQGLSKERTFVKSSVNITLVLKKSEKTIDMIVKSSKSVGSDKSTSMLNAISNINMKKELAGIYKKMMNQTQAKSSTKGE